MRDALETGDYVQAKGRVMGRVECWQGRDLVQVRVLSNPLRLPAFTVGQITVFAADELAAAWPDREKT